MTVGTERLQWRRLANKSRVSVVQLSFKGVRHGKIIPQALYRAQIGATWGPVQGSDAMAFLQREDFQTLPKLLPSQRKLYERSGNTFQKRVSEDWLGACCNASRASTVAIRAVFNVQLTRALCPINPLPSALRTSIYKQSTVAIRAVFNVQLTRALCPINPLPSALRTSIYKQSTVAIRAVFNVQLTRALCPINPLPSALRTSIYKQSTVAIRAVFNVQLTRALCPINPLPSALRTSIYKQSTVAIRAVFNVQLTRALCPINPLPSALRTSIYKQSTVAIRAVFNVQLTRALCPINPLPSALRTSIYKQSTVAIRAVFNVQLTRALCPINPLPSALRTSIYKQSTVAIRAVFNVQLTRALCPINPLPSALRTSIYKQSTVAIRAVFNVQLSRALCPINPLPSALRTSIYKQSTVAIRAVFDVQLTRALCPINPLPSALRTSIYKQSTVAIRAVFNESCRTMPLVGGFSRGSSVSPVLSFRRCSILISIALIGSRDLAVKSPQKLFTHSQMQCALDPSYFLTSSSCHLKGRKEVVLSHKTRRARRDDAINIYWYRLTRLRRQLPITQAAREVCANPSRLISPSQLRGGLNAVGVFGEMPRRASDKETKVLQRSLGDRALFHIDFYHEREIPARSRLSTVSRKPVLLVSAFHKWPRWCSGYPIRLPPMRTGFDLRRGRSRIYRMWESCRAMPLVGATRSSLETFLSARLHPKPPAIYHCESADLQPA
ncbi:hypothetical protein PR048_026115 [Dryococelus australis]|uniref:Uncharacterized protein n=1 Tax=Dryococelus australis TaxID=614101 RepID=A0ABQ9GKG2_9NEOP|nr:hypothetical protein PR048_026115 [Dryococelus australis]